MRDELVVSPGFELNTDEPDMLVVRCWGHWDGKLAARYAKAMRAAMAAYCDRGARWFVCADIREFPPQPPEVAAEHGALMAEAVSLGMVSAASVADNVMTELQITRLASQSQMPFAGFHRSMQSAKRYLREG